MRWAAWCAGVGGDEAFVACSVVSCGDAPRQRGGVLGWLGLGGEAAFIDNPASYGIRGGKNGRGVRVIGNDGGAELRAPTRGDAALACLPRAVPAPAPVASLVLWGWGDWGWGEGRS